MSRELSAEECEARDNRAALLRCLGNEDGARVIAWAWLRFSCGSACFGEDGDAGEARRRDAHREMMLWFLFQLESARLEGLGDVVSTDSDDVKSVMKKVNEDEFAQVGKAAKLAFMKAKKAGLTGWKRWAVVAAAAAGMAAYLMFCTGCGGVLRYEHPVHGVVTFEGGRK